MQGKDRHGEEAAVRGSNEGSSQEVAGGGEPQGRARALLIYLKHRGVLNVEEFRRTNTGLDDPSPRTTAADATIRIGGG